jgi:hypothetical protein
MDDFFLVLFTAIMAAIVTTLAATVLVGIAKR